MRQNQAVYAFREVLRAELNKTLKEGRRTCFVFLLSYRPPSPSRILIGHLAVVQRGDEGKASHCQGYIEGREIPQADLRGLN